MTNKQLPNNWAVTNLKNIVSPTKGKKPIRLENSSFAESVPYIDIKALELNQINQYADIKSSKLFSKGDIAIVWDGARSGWVAKAHNGAIGSTLCALTPIKIDSTYLYYYLLSKYSLINSRPRGVGIPHVDPNFLWSLEIPLPPIAEQKRIANKLDTLFGQVSIIQKALEHIPELIKNFRQQVLTFAVTGKLTEEWRKGKNLTKWKAELASECCEKVQSGGTPKGGKFEESGIPFLKVYNIVHNTIDFISNPQYVSRDIHSSQIKKSISYPGDVIMNIVGPPLNKVAIIPNTYAEWNINQAITLFRPKDYLNNKFLYYFFCEGTPVNRLVNQTRGVVGQINISLTQCRNFLIPIPPIQEQREIVKIIDSLFKKVETIEQQYNALKAKIEKLPQALLNKAFSGELVDHLPSDGCAENLLKEIEQLKRSTKKK